MYVLFRAGRTEQRKLFPLHGLSFSCALGPLEHVHLSLPFVTTKNKEVNATAVLWPSQVGTLTYVWWYGNNTEVGSPSTCSTCDLGTEVQIMLPEAKKGMIWLMNPRG